LIMSRADLLVFWTRPVSGTLMAVFLIVVILPLIRMVGNMLMQKWWKAAAPSRKDVIVPSLIVLAVLGFSPNSHAQEYPSKPVTLVVPYPAGGRTDLTARAVAQYLKAELGQPVLVVNKPGASGVIGAKEVANAAADGYTLGLFSTGFLTAQYMVPTPTNAAEYEFIALVNMDPAAVAVTASRDWQTLQDFLKYGREHPGTLRVGINSGSSAHIFAAAFMQMANLDVIYVPFRGGSERSVALAGGHIEVDFDIVAPLKPMSESKKIRILGIASDRRAEDYPEIPTMTENGVNLLISSWHGVFAPRNTPSAIVAHLSRALEHVCNNPQFVAHMRKLLLGVRYLDSRSFREFFAENDKVNLELIHSLGLYVAPEK
jgi:putative tricarboxylic transport membrane protein